MTTRIRTTDLGPEMYEPPAGGLEPEPKAFVPSTFGPETQDSGPQLAERGYQGKGKVPCAALTKRGVPCGKRIGVRATPDGPRCPSHKPRPETDAPRAPVRAIKTPGDALRLASWAAIEAAEGRIPASRSNAVANICREARRAFAQAQLHELMRTQQELLDAILAFAERFPPGPRPESAFMRDPAVERAAPRWRAAVARWRAVAE